MTTVSRHWQSREARFVGLIALTMLLIALYLGEALSLAGREGSGHRTIDLPALKRRIDAGELRDREAQWYHESTRAETGERAP